MTKPVDGIETIRRARLREPLRTPSWTPPLPPKPRQEAPAQQEEAAPRSQPR
jgi:hypothetical protein